MNPININRLSVDNWLLCLEYLWFEDISCFILVSKYFYDLYYNQRETIKSSLLCKLLARYNITFQNNIKSFEGYKNIFKFAEKFPVWPSEMVTSYFNILISSYSIQIFKYIII